MTPHAQTRGLVMDIPCCIDAVAERPAISHVHKEQVQPYDMDAATDPNCILASICDSNSSFSHFSSSSPPKKLALFIMLPLLVSHRLVHRHVGDHHFIRSSKLSPRPGKWSTKRNFTQPAIPSSKHLTRPVRREQSTPPHMKSEAVETFASKTVRPEALEAAKALVDQENRQSGSTGLSGTEQLPPQDTPTNVPTTVAHSPSPSQDTDDDASRPSTLLSEVIQGAKSAVDDVLSWAEKKVGSLDSEKGGAGPYDSPATCMPSDLDAIASGILPAMPSKSQHNEGARAKRKVMNDTPLGEEPDKPKGQSSA
ncbi:hypothetical protein BM1_09884 [Bipolaris maydis]|nr:hypothetical protein BM1_09884 [Bipolaris maydis]